MPPDPGQKVILPSLPDPEIEPLLRPERLIGFGEMKRTAVYEGIKRGDIPSVRINGRIYVPTGELRRRWMVDPDQMQAAPDDERPALRLTAGRTP